MTEAACPDSQGTQHGLGIYKNFIYKTLTFEPDSSDIASTLLATAPKQRCLYLSVLWEKKWEQMNVLEVSGR